MSTTQRAAKVAFILGCSEDGGITARALDEPLSVRGATFKEVRRNVRQAVRAYFGAEREVQLLAGTRWPVTERGT